jgi:AcrR family transcriptional regulator
MAEPVKRRYDSPRRREQAAATRRQILEAAWRLFERQGYAATTMAAIAAEAGVALKTVYVAFETKSGVLRGVWHLLLRGDVDDVPVGDRRWYQEVLEEPDPEAALRLNARNSRRVKERAGKLIAVIRPAAAQDADIAALWSRIQREFHENQAKVVEALAAKHALRPGLDVGSATDILWTLNHPDVWHLLVTERGWAPEDYERWFGDAACAELLSRTAGGGGSSGRPSSRAVSRATRSQQRK